MTSPFTSLPIPVYKISRTWSEEEGKMWRALRTRAAHLATRFNGLISSRVKRRRFRRTYDRCRDFTMISAGGFADNLQLVESVRNVPGCVVECGVWRGGMSAGMALLLGPGRKYYLFDSFEGLPLAKAIDGEAAIRWQEDREAPGYFGNCTAPEEFAIKAMTKANVPSFRTIKGWFDQSLAETNIPEPIAVLRLDCDWYDSTMTCLEHLFGRVAAGGIVIIDDYYTWDGCSRAVHDFLSRRSSPERIRTCGYFAYILKAD